MRSAAWAGDQPITQTWNDPCCRAAYARFGLRGHNGLDLGCWTGTVLSAMRPGVVQWSGYDGSGYGELVIVRHDDDGAQWYYGHQHVRLVATGDRVAAGTRLGTSGNTGNSSGPHLHLGKRPAGYDPENGFGGFVDPVPDLIFSLAPPPPPVPPVPPVPPTPEEVALMTDWELINYVLAPLYAWAGMAAAFNPDGGIQKCWVAALRAGVYAGRPRTGDRPYGSAANPEAGWWAEFEHRVLIYHQDGTMSWNG